MFGLPKKVIFCSKCLLSNQKPVPTPEFYEKNITILTIKGHCEERVSLLSLNAPLIRPKYLDILLIEKRIKNKKKLKNKDNFDGEIKEKEKSIDTQGLQ
mgnify:CR=1 FL=1